MRYSFDEGLIDLARGEVIDCAELLDELMSFIEEDAERLGCTKEIENLLNILKDGTSAHSQLTVYQQALASGESETDALKSVVDWLMAETTRDL